MNNKKKINIWAIGYSIFLIVFGGITLADAFLIPKQVVEMEEVKKYENPFLSAEATKGKNELELEPGQENESEKMTEKETQLDWKNNDDKKSHNKDKVESDNNGYINDTTNNTEQNIQSNHTENVNTNNAVDSNNSSENKQDLKNELESEQENKQENKPGISVEYDNKSESVSKLENESTTEEQSETQKETQTEAQTEAETEPETEAETESNEPVITENSYSCENFTITISKEHIYDTDVYIADIVVKDVSYLKAGLADNKFGRNLKHRTSTIAKECGAILAVNGDYYGFREEGFVMRNGYLYRTSARDEKNNDALVVSYDGTMTVVDETKTDAEELAENGAFHIFSFGPGLIENGVNVAAENSVASHSTVHNPRTAIGMIEPLHYILVVCDGRTEQSRGLTLVELADVMAMKGCTTAYNLDGGGSSTMYFMGEVINQPTTDGDTIKERRVSDIVYIG